MEARLSVAYQGSYHGPMIKRATVGNVSLAQFALGEKVVVQQSLFYADNQMHLHAGSSLSKR
jgi:hypothetical protein